MMYIETELAWRGWQKLTLANNDSWPPSKRHMDFCLGTSGLLSWSNEHSLCVIVNPDTSSLGDSFYPLPGYVTVDPFLLHRNKHLHSTFIITDFSFNPQNNSTRVIIGSVTWTRN